MNTVFANPADIQTMALSPDGNSLLLPVLIRPFRSGKTAYFESLKGIACYAPVRKVVISPDGTILAASMGNHWAWSGSSNT